MLSACKKNLLLQSTPFLSYVAIGEKMQLCIFSQTNSVLCIVCFYFGLFAYKSSIALVSVNVLLTNFSPLRNFAILILLRSMLVLFLSFEILHFIKRLVFGINLNGHGCELKE